MMVGESWDIFTKRVLVEKHISGVMCKNPGIGHAHSLAPLLICPCIHGRDADLKCLYK